MLDVRKYLLLEFNRSMRSKYFYPGVVGMWGSYLCVGILSADDSHT